MVQKICLAVEALFAAVSETKTGMSNRIKEVFKNIANDSTLATDAIKVAIANARDDLGRTALHYAQIAGDKDAAVLLTGTYKVDANIKDYFGATAASSYTASNAVNNVLVGNVGDIVSVDSGSTVIGQADSNSSSGTSASTGLQSSGSASQTAESTAGSGSSVTLTQKQISDAIEKAVKGVVSDQKQAAAIIQAIKTGLVGDLQASVVISLLPDVVFPDDVSLSIANDIVVAVTQEINAMASTVVTMAMVINNATQDITAAIKKADKTIASETVTAIINAIVIAVQNTQIASDAIALLQKVQFPTGVKLKVKNAAVEAAKQALSSVAAGKKNLSGKKKGQRKIALANKF